MNYTEMLMLSILFFHLQSDSPFKLEINKSLEDTFCIIIAVKQPLYAVQLKDMTCSLPSYYIKSVIL